MPNMNRRPAGARVLSGALALFALLAAGCDAELRKPAPPTRPVSGRITLSGQPLSWGWLELYPLPGTVGGLTSLVIRPDGSFTGPAVPVGRHQIRLFAPGDTAVNRALLESDASWTATIPPGDGTTPVPITLALP